MWIKANDNVKVISGEDRGTRGKVLRVDHEASKLVVEGVNRVYKHVRRSQRNPQGGRLSMEMPISVSNVMLVCGACGAAARGRAPVSGRRIERTILQEMWRWQRHSCSRQSPICQEIM